MTKGQKIKLLRESQNLSQTELAQKISIRKQTLYKYENEIVTNIPSDVIERLSKVLGCSPAYIMGWDEGQAEKKQATDHNEQSEEMEKALDLYRRYNNAIPQVKEAVDTLLKPSQPEP